MRYLLDTCTFLWILADEGKLSEKVKKIFLNGSNKIYFSSVSSFEIAIKVSLGKLSILGNIKKVIQQGIEKNNINNLYITHLHALHTCLLPKYHKDPFDRLLIAQAQIEEFEILSPNQLFDKYNVTRIW